MYLIDYIEDFVIQTTISNEFPDGDSNQYDWRQSIKYNGSIINLSYKKACNL